MNIAEARFKGIMMRATLVLRAAPDAEDLIWARERIGEADAFGCFTNPTGWRDGIAGRALMKGILDGVLPLARAAAKHKAELDALDEATRA